MKGPREKELEKKQRSALPRGGGAAARAYQFALERGLDPDEAPQITPPAPPPAKPKKKARRARRAKER